MGTGADLWRYGTQALGGVADDDKRFFWDCVNQAAMEFVRETRILTGEAAITTVEDGQNYDLPVDFLEPDHRNSRRHHVCRYYDLSDDVYTYPVITTPEKLFQAVTDTARVRPVRVAISLKAPASEVSGTVTGDGAAGRDGAALIDSGADFSGVGIGDRVYNLTDGSSGVVVAVSSGTQLETALFGGTANDWTTGDSYVVSPGDRWQVMLDAPSKSAGDTLTVPYIRKPSPVFHDGGRLGIPDRSERPVCYEAAFLFKADYDFDLQRDRHLHEMYQQEVLRTIREQGARILADGQYPGRP